jgi:hypothetical protein
MQDDVRLCNIAECGEGLGRLIKLLKTVLTSVIDILRAHRN